MSTAGQPVICLEGSGSGHHTVAVTAATAPARWEHTAFAYQGAADVAGGGGVAGLHAPCMPAWVDSHCKQAVCCSGIPDSNGGWHQLHLHSGGGSSAACS